jgi:apoptosis-inducing factor 2
VVLGAGWTGAFAAKELDKWARVTLIGEGDRFQSTPTGVRAFTEAGWGEKSLLRYDGLLKNGTFVQAAVKSVAPDAVTIVRAGSQAPETIKFDYAVIALGVNAGFPIKVGADTAKAVSRWAEVQKAVAAAKDVVIVGGGAVGCEIAGEVKTDFPAANVTLVHGGPSLLSDVTHVTIRDKFAAAVQAKLTAVGVKVVTGKRVNKPEALQPGQAALVAPGTVVTSADGSLSVPADVVIWATGGGVPNSAALREHFAAQLDGAGFVKVTGTLNVEGQPKIFAVGDIMTSEHHEPKQGYHGSLQAKHAAAVIKAHVAGKPAPIYKKGPPAMFVSVRDDDGSSGRARVGVCGECAQLQAATGTRAYFERRSY